MAQYSALRCVSGIWQNNEKPLISNGLRFVVTCLLTAALWVLFHVARHTFATTVYLCNGGTIEALSKILGHKHISTTQIYAVVTNKMVSSDFRAISANLATMQKKVLDKKQKKVKKQQTAALRETA